MNRCAVVLSVAWITAALAVSAQAETIDFDDLPGGIPPVPLPADFTPFAAFSTAAGAQLLVFEAAEFGGTSTPNFLTAGIDPAASPYDADVYVDFTTPVNGLTFYIAGDNDAGSIASVNVFYGGGLSDVIDVVGDGDFSNPVLMDLSAYANVTRIEVVNIVDEFGLAYDDFSFTARAIPEPASAALFLAGALATATILGCQRRLA